MRSFKCHPHPKWNTLLLDPIFQMRKLRQLDQEVAEPGSQLGSLVPEGVLGGGGQSGDTMEPGGVKEGKSFST